jgi:uncharacterized membrane protein
MPTGMPVPPEKASGMAIAALVLSIIGVCCLIPAVVGLALGFIEMNKIKSGESSAKGYGLAKAAVIVGIIAIALSVLSTIYMISTGGFNFEFSTQS